MISLDASLRQYRLNSRALTVWLVLAALLYLCVLGWLVFNKPLIFTLVLLAVPIAVVIVTQPRLALLQFIVVLFIERAVREGTPVFVIDVSAALVVAAAAIDVLNSHRLPQRLPAFTWNFLYIIAAVVVTAMVGYWPQLVTIRLMSWSVLVLTFLSLYRLSGTVGVERLLRWFVTVAALNAAYVLIPFVASRGAERSFGFAGVLFDDLALVALPVSLALYLGATRGRGWIYLLGSLCCLGGLVATQSRLSIVLGLVVSAFVLFYAYRSSRRSTDQAYRCLVSCRLRLLVGAGFAAAALLPILQPDILTGVIERFQTMVDNPFDRLSTASYRIHLWQRALTAFVDHPLFGVGPGGFVRLYEIYPTMHLAFDYHLTFYMGAHNVLLEFLATMGLVGGAGLIALVINTWRVTRRSVRRATPAVGFALISWASAFVVTVLIEGNWMWGQLSFLMIFFAALIARQYAHTNSVPDR